MAISRPRPEPAALAEARALTGRALSPIQAATSASNLHPDGVAARLVTSIGT